jgi:DNA mismatch repair protein MutS2
VDAETLAALELPAILGRLAAQTATELGAERALAVAPSIDAHEVGRRQALTSEGVALLDAGEAPELAGSADLRAALERAERGGSLTPAELRSVVTSIRVACEARRALETQSTIAPGLATIATAIEPSLTGLAAELDRQVEEDGSDLRDHASPELRRLRTEVRGGAERIRRELTRIAASADVRDALQEAFVAERAGRPVLAVRVSDRARVPGLVHDASSSGQTLFVEPFAVVELGNRLAEAAAAAREEEARILQLLSGQVAARSDELRLLVEAVADIDLVLACGAISRSWGGAPVGAGDAVRVVAARHPLLDAATAVPIDLDLGTLRAVVISGPNAGGKTVALKTLGLAVLLHQCGLRPPAATAVLPVFDRVLVDIGDHQSIAMSLSTFSGHLRTLVEILGAATGRSLVLLDEVAAGTDPEEGAALAQALVSRLAQQARLTIATTHYAALKDWASATDGVANAATAFDPDSYEPLFRLALGRPGGSHALRIAERLGLPGDVVADARSRVSPALVRAGELLADAEAAERQAAELRDAARLELDSARAHAAELERVLEAQRASAERVRTEAVADVERDLAAARAELAELRAGLRETRRHEKVADRDRALGAATERARAAERALADLSGPAEPGGELAPGDPVEAPDVGVRGTIAAIRGEEAEVVGAAGQRVRIPLGRLRPSRERAPEERAPAVRVRAAATSAASDHVDVRGLSREEARERVRRLVDDASLAGLGEVRVVHGRGTGALRRAVREELASHPLVAGSEPDADDGATLARLA